jgi:2-polyprenyl-3-methyl-5-hydroxy-6-metoxy-1,4-benzoquinol methylase
MNKRDIIDFFDRFAPQWDADMVRNEAVINCILENGGIDEGVSVLDVACGTGVLIPDYLDRDVDSVTGVDISPKMISIAEEKFSQSNVRFVCSDVETVSFESSFDRVVVYNAFPHFFNPLNLVKVLAGHLNSGGMLTVAHGMSREAINRHHEGSASQVSIELLNEDELEKLLEPYFDVVVKISDDRMYQVAGVKK